MTADEIARRIVAEAVAPNCAAGCALRTASWHREVGGDVDVLFDLASVTKPLTAVAVARAGIAPATTLGALLEEARGTASERVTIEHLLAHRAGLEAHRPLYAPLLRGESVDVAAALREAADARRVDAAGDVPPDGFAPLYSDLGYILVGAALARAVGARDAGEAIARLVLEPLGIAGAAGTVRDLKERGVGGPFAPTEEVGWRGGLIHGAVHDENAWALTGFGGSGHSGLFATADAVLAFGGAVLDALQGRTIALGNVDLHWLVRERPGSTLRAGFDGKSPAGSSAGAKLAITSFGHLGFVGTSLWIDPENRTIVTVLTNRVRYGRNHLAIRSARPWAHGALCSRAREISSVET
jgi:CubicO group peptidase (beta-lactamase class C family)